MTNRKNWPVGLSTSHFGALAGREAVVFAEYRRAGIRIAELSQSDGQLMAAGFYEHPRRIRDAAEAEGVTLRSFHIPFSQTLHPANLDPAADRAAMERIRRSMHAAAEADIRIFVVHRPPNPSGKPNGRNASVARAKISPCSFGKRKQSAQGSARKTCRAPACATAARR